MQLYQQTYQLYLQHNPGCVHPDILLTTGSLVKKLKQGFRPHLPVLGVMLETGLSNPDDPGVCAQCVAMVGNPLASSFELDFLPFAQKLLPEIIRLINRSDGVSIKIKLACLNAIGDTALHLGGGFENFVEMVMPVISAAAAIQMDADNVPSVNRLREAVIECYVSMMHGLNAGNKVDTLKHTVSAFLNLLNLVVVDCRQNRTSTEVLKQSVTALGDLVIFFKGQFCQHIREAEGIRELLEYARQTGDEDVLKGIDYLQKSVVKFSG